MVGQPLRIGALGAVTVGLPRLAQFPLGATVPRTASFVMHAIQPFSPPAAGEGAEIGRSGDSGEWEARYAIPRTPRSARAFSPLKFLDLPRDYAHKTERSTEGD